MDLSKIELLIKKIDLAVRTIRDLKEENKKTAEKAKRSEGENGRLKQEAAALKKENQALKDEMNSTNAMHEKLENKIQEILNQLPDIEDDNGGVKKNAVLAEEKSETPKAPVSKKENAPGELANKKNPAVRDEDKDAESSDEAIRFEEPLIENSNDDNDIDFHFDSEDKEDDDLPRGVL